jgi:tetratricopeptide (TPR) repeat protein
MRKSSAQQVNSHRFRILVSWACLIFALSMSLDAQTSVPAPLPPAAQEAFDKGIMAAKEGGYIVAIRYLQDARKIAPQAPQIFRSLGAVEAKIPGREMRAMAWYGAYLAATPNAPDAAEVKKEFARLEVKSEINTSSLIKQAQDSAGQIPGGYDHDNSLVSVVALWAKVGDITAALKTADSIPAEGWVHKGYAQKFIAEAQAQAGDIGRALKTADLIRSDETQVSAQIAIARVQLTSGDLAGAKKTLASAQESSVLSKRDEFSKSHEQQAIAYAQVEAGDIDGAKNTLTSAQKQADLFTDQSLKSGAQLAIAKAQLNAGDIAEAEKTLASAIKTAYLIQQYMAKTGGWLAITTAQLAFAEAQIRSGDIAGARKTLASALKTADLIEDSFTYPGVASRETQEQLKIAKAQAMCGDIVGAQETADLIQDANYKRWAQSAIAEAKAGNTNVPNSTHQSTPDAKPPIQPAITVSDWLDKLDDDRTVSYFENDRCPLNTVPFLDLADYLKSLPPSNNPQKVFESLEYAAKTIVTAQNVITGMLKQQANK